MDAETKERLRRRLRYFAQEGLNFHVRALNDSMARQLLDAIEEVSRETPFKRQRIAFSHLDEAPAETIERIKKLGGAISVLDRMALGGERDGERVDKTGARNAPQLRALMHAGLALGAGTDGFHSGNYSPMLSLWWLVTGKGVGGTTRRDAGQNLTRAEALRLHTNGGAWLTFDEANKGSIEPGKLADLAVLNADYLAVPEDQIRSLESLLTMVGGRIVHGAGPFARWQR